jgi:hypothetical protein
MRQLMLLAALLPSAAWAYSSAAQFDTGPSADSTGGAAGIYYTGSPRFQGQSCAGCHTGGEAQMQIELASSPPDLFDGGYTPGSTYLIKVDLVDNLRRATDCDAHAGEACDLNLFAIEALDPRGRPAGTLCPVAPTAGCDGDVGSPTRRTRDGTTLLANGLTFSPDGVPLFRDGETRYDFYWQAPSTDLGPVAFWLAAVDGDGAAANPDLPTDVAGDATGVFKVTICGPGGCPEPKATGCNQTPTQPSGWLLALLTFALWRPRRNGAPR